MLTKLHLILSPRGLPQGTADFSGELGEADGNERAFTAEQLSWQDAQAEPGQASCDGGRGQFGHWAAGLLPQDPLVHSMVSVSLSGKVPCISPPHTHRPLSQAQVPGHRNKIDMVPTLEASRLRKGMKPASPP